MDTHHPVTSLFIGPSPDSSLTLGLELKIHPSAHDNLCIACLHYCLRARCALWTPLTFHNWNTLRPVERETAFLRHRALLVQINDRAFEPIVSAQPTLDSQIFQSCILHTRSGIPYFIVEVGIMSIYMAINPALTPIGPFHECDCRHVIMSAIYNWNMRTRQPMDSNASGQTPSTSNCSDSSDYDSPSASTVFSFEEPDTLTDHSTIT